jgi:leucyl aminopeptidase
MREVLKLVAPALKSGDFRAHEGETLLVYPDRRGEARVLLLGLGLEAEVTPERVRRAYAVAVKIARQKKLATIAAAFPEMSVPSDLPAIEGMSLANYAFNSLKGDSLKDDPTVLLKKVIGIHLSKERLAACKENLTTIEAVHFARDLVNGNADDVTPQFLAATARRLAEECPHVKTTVFDKKRIEKEKMGLLLAVSRGSFREPAFIIVEYKGNPDSSDVTAMVGKGITYDTGGLNIKPTGSMETMKDDMAGAAAVLGTIRAASLLKLKVNLLGIVVSSENAIGSYSYKPGDVYMSHSGKTVEIANTDAEGRLVLADAISYLQTHYHPNRIIDLATLTGGIIVALGEEATGLFSNDDKLAAALMEAGEETHERLWRFPLYPEYREALKSSIADVKNSPNNRQASSINGAMFIGHFVKKGIPWAHLDIAGTAFITAPKYYHPTQATGVGVRLLVQFLATLASRSS